MLATDQQDYFARLAPCVKFFVAFAYLTVPEFSRKGAKRAKANPILDSFASSTLPAKDLGRRRCRQIGVEDVVDDFPAAVALFLPDRHIFAAVSYLFSSRVLETHLINANRITQLT